ncbi:MAG: sialidase family protein [Acidobacteriota bacterium]|jgi:hypothetical protein
MSQRRAPAYLRIFLAVCGLLAPPAFTAEEVPPERPDDPYVPLEGAAPSESAVVVRGNHVSVQVNVDALGNNILGDAANEPSIAMDPTDPGNLVIGWRQFDTVASNFRQAGWAYSHDGGATWTFPGVLQPGQFRSDPVLAADGDGTFLYYSLSSATSAEMFRSTDGGLSWSGPYAGLGGDKQWFAVDTTGGIGDGHIYPIWNSQFTCCAAGTDYGRSVDGGFTFQGAYAMPLKSKWGTVDVGPAGEVYVVGANLNTFQSPQHIVQRSSSADNPGQQMVFEYGSGIDLGGTTQAGGTPNPGGLLGQVWVAVDRSSAATRGNAYVLASVDPPSTDLMDVHFIRSEDGGFTWSSPVRVNDDPADSGAWQWFGTMSVAPDGRIDVVWNDTRSDPSGTISELYYAWSRDGGNTWSSGIPVSPPFDSTVGYPNQNKIGDYYHMVSDLQGGALAYSATFNGEQDVWFLRVGDCNDSGQHDSLDISDGTSLDCNGNGIPDECEAMVEVCDDGVDNDCDGVADCFDPDCFGEPDCACDFDGTCEAGETCGTCPSDCFGGSQGCGNGVCETRIGENCIVCPEDCAGRSDGNGPFCCGELGGTNPVSCMDPRCNENGFVCIAPYDPPCCGDGACTVGETPCLCELDCGPMTSTENSCGDGIDNDCDGVLDCADGDCASAAPPPPVGSPLLTVRRVDLDFFLDWQAVAGAAYYDVVHGGLDVLRTAGGDFAVATHGCDAAGVAGLGARATPSFEDAWFLVRPGFCSATGSYDTGAPGQAASRDGGIAASGNDCP